MVSKPKNFAVFAGGTGGHVFPALAVAKKLIDNGHNVCWFGTRQGIEHRLVPNSGIEIKYIPASGFRGKGFVKKLLGIINLMRSIAVVLFYVLRLKPNAVICFGGYVSVSGGVASFLLRCPLLVHEQNSVIGSANKLISKIASKCLQAYPGTLERAVWVGNPVRKELVGISKYVLGIDKSTAKINVLVLGGSLGASALNEKLPAVLAKSVNKNSIQVLHQSGRNRSQGVAALYQSLNLSVEVKDFVEDMAAVYSWADLVICRAGALTVAEIMAAGLPAVFVPFPYATDNHQYHNAKYLVNKQGAWLVSERELESDNTIQMLSEIFSDPDLLTERSLVSYAAFKANAVDSISSYCEEIAA